MSDESAEQISKNVREAMLNPALEEYRFHYIDMRDITEVQRMSLVERHLISPDLGKLLTPVF
jgi:protein-arginine kinase